MSECTQLVDMASAGVAPALRAVDCMAGEMTASAFNRLFGIDGALMPVLTICLTLYIAFFAISLLTGRSRIGISALTPRMITLGLVLTFATSWIAYSQVFWNLAVAGPDWIASVLTGSDGSASRIFADRIDIVFAAIGQVADLTSAAGGGQGGGQAATGGASGMFQPTDIMWLGALLLLLGTVGVLLTARIALAVLMALGPVFVVLALFGPTRGLTAGWLKGVALTALVPLFVVLGGSITLELLVPVISALSQSAALGAISARAAIALFLIASVHVALMAMIIKLAITIVSGWKVFGMASREERDSRVLPQSAMLSALAQPVASQAPAASAATGGQRRTVVTGAAVTATPSSESASTTAANQTRRVVVQSSANDTAPLPSSPPHRARGVGSRFRSPPDQFRKMRA